MTGLAGSAEYLQKKAGQRRLPLCRPVQSRALAVAGSRFRVPVFFLILVLLTAHPFQKKPVALDEPADLLGEFLKVVMLQRHTSTPLRAKARRYSSRYFWTETCQEKSQLMPRRISFFQEALSS